jgi:hypothetical protein
MIKKERKKDRQTDRKKVNTFIVGEIIYASADDAQTSYLKIVPTIRRVVMVTRYRSEGQAEKKSREKIII